MVRTLGRPLGVEGVDDIAEGVVGPPQTGVDVGLDAPVPHLLPSVDRGVRRRVWTMNRAARA
jgi:hypothetical protein